ncbi:hemerythrin domain-containing protein [Microbulbifer elongatus]|uniref:hemerythrin domain-containing protein n=1 Tax=Microbulbifer elongatus TaxID=86173 RepID=UPI001E2A8C58|nr:hemerythrin domain-containing protein [Microbulbifer elongatus]
MPQNAIEILKKDHEHVLHLLDQLTDTTTRAVKGRKELLEKIADELSIHTTLEEEIFYPAFKDATSKSKNKMYYEACEEHRAVESLVLPDLQNTEPDSVSFSGRAKVLKELVEHHANEEEEDMFPVAKEVMTSEELEELGEKMRKRKNALKKGH